MDDELHHDGAVVDFQRLGDALVHLGLVGSTQTDTPHRLGEHREVREVFGVEVGVGVAGVVEQGLPLPDHAQRMVVDDRDLDRDPVQGTRDQFLVGHLETAIAVDAPHHLFGLSHLGSHGRGNAEPHGARTTGGEPFHRPLVGQEVRRPHLVLSDPGDVDGVLGAELPDALDDLLRRELPIRCLVPAGLVAFLHPAEDL